MSTDRIVDRLQPDSAAESRALIDGLLADPASVPPKYFYDGRHRADADQQGAVGVTAAFNRNVLVHGNRLLGSNFRPAQFAHRGLYNAAAGRIEMHLEACSYQDVVIDGRQRRYAAGERIHTANSYKYAPREFAALLREAGFSRIRSWTDARGHCNVFYAE